MMKRIAIAGAALIALLGTAVILAQPAQAAVGIRISNGRLVEGNGTALMLRGINHPHTWFKTQTKAEATSRLLAAGLPIGPVQNAQEIYDDPQVAARRLMIEVPDPILGTVKLVGPVAKLSGSPEPVTRPAPLLGEHNAEVLMEMLGYTKEQVSRLQEDGVIALAKEKTSR